MSAPRPRTLRVPSSAAALLGAGAAFGLSAALLSWTALSPTEALKLLYSVGILPPDVAVAGSAPEPFLEALAGLLSVLALLCGVAAAVAFAWGRWRGRAGEP